MSPVWMVASLTLSLMIAWLTLKPLIVSGFRNREDSTEAETSLSQRDAKERALRGLKDLDLDYKMGKLSDADYADAKERLSAEVARFLNEAR